MAGKVKTESDLFDSSIHTKRCARCKETMPLSAFSKMKRCKTDGRQVYCRTCASQIRIKAMRNDPEHTAKARAKCLRWRQKLKLEAFNAYGGTICACCGEIDFKTLQLDHINNTGSYHRKDYMGFVKRNANGRDGAGCDMYALLRKHKYPPGFQVLCANCNFAKALNGGRMPEWRRTPSIAVYTLAEYAAKGA